MADRMMRGQLAGARVLAVDASKVAAETARRHELDQGAAQRAAELVVANLLLAAWIKGEERSTLQMAGEGWSFYGEIDAEGRLRARLQPASLVPRPVFDGTMLVLKYDAVRELYRGSTNFRQATVEGALQRHLAQSDQVDVGICVRVDERGASGLLVERLPDAAGFTSFDPASWAALRLRVPQVHPLDVVETGQLVQEPVTWLEERALTWRCRCSDDAVRSMLIGLGDDTLRELIEQDHGAEVTCHFCNTARRFDERELCGMLSRGDA